MIIELYSLFVPSVLHCACYTTTSINGRDIPLIKTISLQRKEWKGRRGSRLHLQNCRTLMSFAPWLLTPISLLDIRLEFRRMALSIPHPAIRPSGSLLRRYNTEVHSHMSTFGIYNQFSFHLRWPETICIFLSYSSVM